MPIDYNALPGEANNAQIIFRARDIVEDGLVDTGNLIGRGGAQTGVTGQNGKLKAVVVLPAPPTFQFKYAADWEKITLGQFGAAMAKINPVDILKTAVNLAHLQPSDTDKDFVVKVGCALIADKVINYVKSTSVFEAMSTGMRGAIGTKETTKQLFKEMKPRSFSFSFLLSPKNKLEAENIKAICKVFRFYMHPFTAIDILDSLKIVNYPAVWDLEYINGFRNHIPVIKTCVLVDYSEQYGSDKMGVTTLSADGYPVQTKIDLTFNELNLLDRSDIQGNSDGVISSVNDKLTSGG